MAIPQTMKALRLVKYGTPYDLQEVPVPSIGDNDLLVKVGAASFCHTDYQVYEGVYQSPCPMTPSHEPAGTVVAVGKKAAGHWELGQRVGMLNFRHACNECVGCRTVRDPCLPDEPDCRFCEKKEMAGINSDGGFAEYVVADVNTTVSLPENLPFEQAAPLMCAGATVWTAIQAAKVKPGLPVGVIGIGGLGYLAVQFARALGHPTVAIDNRHEGLQLASEAPDSLRPQKIVDYKHPNAVDEVVAFAGDGGLAAVVLCTDNVEAIKWSLKLLRTNGVCSVLGLPTDELRFNAFDLVFKQLSVVGSLVANQRLVSDMMELVGAKGVRSHVTTLALEEACHITDRYMEKGLKGRLVVKM